MVILFFDAFQLWLKSDKAKYPLRNVRHLCFFTPRCFNIQLATYIYNLQGYNRKTIPAVEKEMRAQHT
jgi:hypothetical protein